MTHDRDIERILDRWLADGSSEAPDRVVNVVADRIGRQRQRLAWRLLWQDRFTDVAAGMIGRAAAVVVVAALALVAVMVVAGPADIGPVATPSPTSSSRSFELEVDKLVDPTDTIPVTIRDDSGLLVSVDPHPANVGDWDRFRGAGRPTDQIVIVNPDGDQTKALVLWLADPTCDERVAMTVTRDGDRIVVSASVTSPRVDFSAPDGVVPSGPSNPDCGGTVYPLGVVLRLSESVSADRFSANLVWVPGE
jgi:hypothetical protein